MTRLRKRAGQLDGQNGGVHVSVNLNAESGKIMRQTTHDNVGKRMGIVMYEQQPDGKTKGEVISLATIQSEFGDAFQITGARALCKRRKIWPCCCARAHWPRR